MEEPQLQPGIPPKPVAQDFRPEITRLPVLRASRRAARRLLWWLARFLVWLLTRPEIHGSVQAIPDSAALVVSNHLGNADLVFGVAAARRLPEVIAKAELRQLPVVGLLMRAYGMIWVHRGRPDRAALRAALQGLAEGRIVCIAPEGRESVTGALEEATRGAAFLAIKSGAPIVPVTFTGTENHAVWNNIRRLRRTPVSMTIGQPFYLRRPAPDASKTASESRDLGAATLQIMQTLASQLPDQYRGVYAATASAAPLATESPSPESQ